jgi:hypothetical protein
VLKRALLVAEGIPVAGSRVNWRDCRVAGWQKRRGRGAR